MSWSDVCKSEHGGSWSSAVVWTVCYTVAGLCFSRSLCVKSTYSIGYNFIVLVWQAAQICKVTVVWFMYVHMFLLRHRTVKIQHKGSGLINFFGHVFIRTIISGTGSTIDSSTRHSVWLWCPPSFLWCGRLDVTITLILFYVSCLGFKLWVLTCVQNCTWKRINSIKAEKFI